MSGWKVYYCQMQDTCVSLSHIHLTGGQSQHSYLRLLCTVNSSHPPRSSLMLPFIIHNVTPFCWVFLVARLYLNTRGQDFEGGDFAFLDDGAYCMCACACAHMCPRALSHISWAASIASLHKSTPKHSLTPHTPPADADRVVEPRAGRLLYFTSGPENL